MSNKLMALSLLLMGSAAAHAQDDVGSLPAIERAVYALTGAVVHTGGGETIENAVVVVRDGLIEAVGSGIEVPADARTIDLSGMHLYPGLIDALTENGLKKSAQPSAPDGSGGPPGPPGRGEGRESDDPDAEGPGLYPHRRAADMLDDELGKKLESWRENGILTVHVTPDKGIFRGQTAVVNIGGGDVDHLIVRSPVLMTLSFSGLSGRQYPGSLMGVIAHIRQTLLDAKHYGLAEGIYKGSPRGVRRPPTHRGLEALQPVVNGELPVVFPAEEVREIRRALKMAQEHGLTALVAGGFEADQVAEELNQNDVVVLFSLDLPKKPRDTHPEYQESLATLRHRVNSPKVPSRLQEAGVRFAFYSGGARNPKDYLDGLRRVVEEGLSKEDALRAATLSAAEILGVGQTLGSVEKGKIANLIVTNKDLFESDAQVRHVFVDGHKYDFPEKEKPAAASGDAIPVGALAGTWDVTVETPGGPRTLTLDLEVSGSSISGSVTSQELGRLEIEEGSIDGGSFSFTVNADMGAGPTAITFSGTLSDDRISGTADVAGLGGAPFEGTKVP